MKPSDLIAAFDNSFPRAFQIEMLKQLGIAYKESHLIASSEYGSFHKNVRPQLRVEKFNKTLLDLASDFGLKTEPCLTVAKNYRFALLEGKEMRLGVKLGTKPLKLPKACVYRKKLAATNSAEIQLSILEEVKVPASKPNVISIQEYKESKTPDRCSPYGILVHGYSESSSLNFAQVLVPDAEYTTHLASIDLVARYPGLLSVPLEEVIEISQPTIRKKNIGEDDA